MFVHSDSPCPIKAEESFEVSATMGGGYFGHDDGSHAVSDERAMSVSFTSFFIRGGVGKGMV